MRLFSVVVGLVALLLSASLASAGHRHYDRGDCSYRYGRYTMYSRVVVVPAPVVVYSSSRYYAVSPYYGSYVETPTVTMSRYDPYIRSRRFVDYDRAYVPIGGGMPYYDRGRYLYRSRRCSDPAAWRYRW